jgi:hypothetical protein
MFTHRSSGKYLLLFCVAIKQHEPFPAATNVSLKIQQQHHGVSIDTFIIFRKHYLFLLYQ